MILNYEEGDVFGPGEVKSTGPLMWEPDHVAAGKPAPRPQKPTKKPKQPLTLGQLSQKAKNFKAPPISLEDQEGYEFEAEGGQPEVRLNIKPSTNMDFKTPLFGITMETPKAKLKPVKARRRADEGVDEFAIRQAKFEHGLNQKETQAKAERAAARSKVQPDKWSAVATLKEKLPEGVVEQLQIAFPLIGLVGEKYPIAAAEGAANVMNPIFGAIDRMDNQINTYGAFEPENQMPRLNAKESGEFGVKVATGLGSTVPFALAGALGGLPATAILGAASNAGQVYDEARIHGVSDQEALMAAIPGALIGSLEGLMGLGTGQFLKQIGKGTAKGILKGIGEEEFQELSTQLANTVNAKYLSGYDPKRALSEGLWETFTTTLGTAGLMHGATAIGSPQQRSTQAVESLPIAEQLEVGTALADPSPRSFASFKPNELQAMEQRALEAGKPVALRPETRDAYTARNQEIKTQLLAVDPASSEFARLADEHTRLARAIDDSPATVPQSAEELRQHLIQMNMGHEGAAGEMLDILRPPTNESPLKMDLDKFETAHQSSVQGARFYPLNNETKGGSVYVTPQTLEDTGLIGKGQRSDVAGLNVSLDDAWNSVTALQESQPDAAAALTAAVKEAEAKGISKISILTYAEGQGFKETRKLMRHESFHSGQQAAAEAADAVGIDPRDLHSPDLIYNPLVGKAAQSENGQAILKYYEGNQNDLALEMAAYSAADQHDYLGLTKEEAASYLTDYLTGIADLHGADALDALAGTARLSPRVDKQVKEISSNAKPKENFGQANRDFAAQLRTQPSASGRPPGPEGRSEGGGSVDEGRVTEGGDQDEVGRVVGGTVEGEGIGAPPADGGPSGVVDKENPLYTTVLTSDVVKEYAKKSGEALRKLGLLDENSLLPPHEQILKVLKERPDLAEPAALGAALREQGVTGEETLKQIDEAAANAGRTLQAIQAADAEWAQLIKQHPEVAAELAKAGVGPKPEQIIKQGLKEVQASILGRSLWRRSGDLFRKMLLTRFSTAANNAVSTVPRIPLDLIDGAMTGTAMGMLQPKKWAGKSDATVTEGAKAGALAGMQASTRVAMAFPDIARRILRRTAPAHEFNEMIIAQMEQLHPDLHSKLEGRSTGLDEFKESSVKLDTIRDLLPYLNDGAKFKEYSAKLDMYQKRYDFNHKLAGKLFDKTNWTYDQFLKPGNVQEFFFRRPYFVGALAKRAATAGFDLSELATNAGTLKDFAADPGGKDAKAIMQLRTLADLPPEVWEAAADDALTFTYAYNPHRDRGGVEKFASHYIEFMDSLGLVGAVVDAFPKAVYNGLKFAYEYGPVGMIKPIANITDNVYQGGGRNGIEYNDVSRISKALLGTAMYVTAIGIRKELGGEEWWQIKTGKKNKKGEPEYLNVKKWMPFAGFLYIADLILRMKNGRMIDKKPGDDMAELYLGARRADSGGTVFSESIKEVANYWASGDPLDDTLLNKAGKPLGNILGAPLTPFINLRDLIAQFDEDEAARRDVKERPFLGPAIDKIPWLRSSEKYGLPLYQPPTELAPRPASAQPALTELGIATDPGSNFATREFSRLGLSPVRWLRPDPDPLINRAQYAAYAEVLQELGPALEADPTYKVSSDAEKGAMWEQLLSGPEGYASMAKAQGELANPEEIQRRELLKTQGPLQRKASGLEKEVKEMKKQAQPRP